MKILKWKSLKTWLIGLILVLPAVWPLVNDKFFLMHDYTHVTRLVEMERAINEGHFPVRWSRNLGYGYGMPLFSFYGPLIYYIGYFFLLFGLNHVLVVKLLFAINFLMSWVFMYKFAKYFWGKWGGLVSATAFIYVPYRAVDFYVRGALGELTGITFIAITLYFLLKLRIKRSSKWVGLTALSLAGLMMSHNLMALIGVPALGLVAIGLFVTYKKRVGKKFRKFLSVLAAFFLGLGLSAHYWVPALVEKSFTAVELLVSEGGHYSIHFAYLRQFLNSPWGYNGSVWGLADELSFEIGKVHVALVVFSILGLYLAIKKGKKLASVMLVVSGLIVSSSVLLSTEKTLFLWENVPGLNYLQFPWRFLSLIIVFVSFMAGGTTWFLVSKRRFWGKRFAAGLMLVLIGFNLRYFEPRGYLEDDQLLYYTSSEQIQEVMSEVIPDYTHPDVGLKKLHPKSPNNRYEWIQGEEINKPEIIVDRGHEFALEVPPGLPGLLRINIFDFPGWTLFVDGERSDYQLGKELPVIEMQLTPPDVGRGVLISGKLMDTSVRKWSNIFSVMCLMVVGGIIVKERKQ